MTTVNFNNEATKIVTVKELENLFNSIGLNWYGWNNVSINDRDIFEDKMQMVFEPTKDGMVRLHDDNFVWED